MKISILTLFPQMFKGPFDYSIINRAKEKGLAQINLLDIRDFGIGKHRTVDDKPYGGGVGMVIRVDVLHKAINHALDKRLARNEQKVILLSPSGKTYSQKMARSYSKLKHLVIVCGHYEGIDDRVLSFVDEEVSVGEFVLTGGEIPAMIIVDSVTRLIKGVLKDNATKLESFSNGSVLEHPQYTRPAKFGKLHVPALLISGDHAKISEWKKKQSLKKTGLKR